MKIYVLIFLATVTVSVHDCNSESTKSTKRSEDYHDHHHHPGGIWRTKREWKAHWIKQWELRKVWAPAWKKVWAPVDIKEWIPFPEPHHDDVTHLHHIHPETILPR